MYIKTLGTPFPLLPTHYFALQTPLRLVCTPHNSRFCLASCSSRSSRLARQQPQCTRQHLDVDCLKLPLWLPITLPRKRRPTCCCPDLQPAAPANHVDSLGVDVLPRAQQVTYTCMNVHMHTRTNTVQTSGDELQAASGTRQPGPFSCPTTTVGRLWQSEPQRQHSCCVVARDEAPRLPVLLFSSSTPAPLSPPFSPALCLAPPRPLNTHPHSNCNCLSPLLIKSHRPRPCSATTSIRPSVGSASGRICSPPPQKRPCPNTNVVSLSSVCHCWLSSRHT